MENHDEQFESISLDYNVRRYPKQKFPYVYGKSVSSMEFDSK